MPNFREIVTLLKADGWILDSTKGSHHHFKHPIKKGKVTVALHGSKDLAPKTIQSIKKQAQLK